jgi:methylenetetrahydrofolate reductase (NADPH)
MSNLQQGAEANAECDSGKVLSRLLSQASIELSATRAEQAAAIAAKLPQGTSVFISHLPRHSLAQSLSAVQSLHKAGLRPVPHVAARRIASRDEFTAFMRIACGQSGVRRLLLIGGDLGDTSGPFADAEAVLADPAIAGSGIREISFAVYPEEHPRIPAQQLEDALDRKIKRASAMGLSVSLLTQLCFTHERITACIDAVASRYPQVALHIGVAGPTSLMSLARYAQTCGVANSFGSLVRRGCKSFRLATSSDPLRELVPVAAHLTGRNRPNIAGTHFFAFGGAIATADWIANEMAKRRGQLDLKRTPHRRSE